MTRSNPEYVIPKSYYLGNVVKVTDIKTLKQFSRDRFN